jgi:hypothetical protein
MSEALYFSQHPIPDGYDKICPGCDARWGDKKFGRRTLIMDFCPVCCKKMAVRDNAIEKNSRKAMISETLRRGLKNAH